MSKRKRSDQLWPPRIKQLCVACGEDVYAIRRKALRGSRKPFFYITNHICDPAAIALYNAQPKTQPVPTPEETKNVEDSRSCSDAL